MQTDTERILAFKAGDVEAFDQIFHRYHDKILQFSLGLLRDHDSAQEMVQEVFVNLWEKRSQVKADLNFDNYIFTIAYNAIRKHFRKKAIASRAADHLLQASPDLIDTPESELILRELMEIAESAIEKLPPQRKLVYRMSREEGLKIKEIAAKLQISPRTAETHLSRALRFLKEEFAKTSLLGLLYFYLFLF
ncbi:MAG: RNA polymerase sigma-70 factor [Bacteroidales bacterium]